MGGACCPDQLWFPPRSHVTPLNPPSGGWFAGGECGSGSRCGPLHARPWRGGVSWPPRRCWFTWWQVSLPGLVTHQSSMFTSSNKMKAVWTAASLWILFHYKHTLMSSPTSFFPHFDAFLLKQHWFILLFCLTWKYCCLLKSWFKLRRFTFSLCQVKIDKLIKHKALSAQQVDVKGWNEDLIGSFVLRSGDLWTPSPLKAARICRIRDGVEQQRLWLADRFNNIKYL